MQLFDIMEPFEDDEDDMAKQWGLELALGFASCESAYRCKMQHRQLAKEAEDVNPPASAVSGLQAYRLATECFGLNTTVSVKCFMK